MKANSPTIFIRKALTDDIPLLVALSYEKRKAYEKAQPLFWRHAVDAEKSQTQWFEALLLDPRYMMLVASQDSTSEKDQASIIGFVIGQKVKTPEVYDLGGYTCVVDDFCVRNDTLWSTVGGRLIAHLKKVAQENGCTQWVIVAGNHDNAKCGFLDETGLSIASRWYVGTLGEKS